MQEEKNEALKTAYDYINKLILGIENVSNLIQVGKEVEGIKELIPVLDGIEYISKIIDLTKEVHVEEINLEELNNQLKEIIDAFENEDYVLLGDLLNYELIPTINNIQEKINNSIK